MEKISFETFKEFDTFSRNRAEQKEPDCFNGKVSFRKYKITVEEIEEPVEVLAERLQKMWDESTNMHHTAPIKAAAQSIGYKLKSEF